MKVKLIKMGMDIDETRNCRVRGIVETKDGEYLFIELLRGIRPSTNYFNSKEEYFKQYPIEEYVWIDGCFRVDVPEDKSKNYTEKYAEFGRKSFRDIPHSKEGIIKILQMLNPEIDDIELTDEYYIDKFCDERGFYGLYNPKLEHSYEPIKIKFYDEKNNEAVIKMLYTCYSADKKYKYEDFREDKVTIDDDFISKYGVDTTNILIEEYKERRLLR